MTDVELETFAQLLGPLVSAMQTPLGAAGFISALAWEPQMSEEVKVAAAKKKERRLRIITKFPH